MASEKRCLYEVLGLRKDCSPDEIRSAYKKLALQCHPDKLVQSGVSQAEATAQFQELVHAYEVLSDAKERAWYDSHRSQILFSDLNSASNSVPNSVIPNLFSYFSNTAYSGYSDSGKGFYKVYSELFNNIYSNEINFVKKLGLRMDLVREAPIMGNLESPYGQVTAFYNYWLGFITVMDFCWVDQYNVMAGPNRKSRRVMEEENNKLRKKAKREYNETVRGLAAFVKKRDKRVIDMMVKKNEEIERKRKEETERKKKLQKEKMDKARKYEEPEWARINDEDDVDNVIEEELLEEEKEKEKKRSEFYCVVCGKKFKSEKQWKNHEQSKKHKEKVAELRESFADEDEMKEEEFGELDDEIAELEERLKESSLDVEEREGENGVGELSGDDTDEENEFFDVAGSVDDMDGHGAEIDGENENEDEDDEMSLLKAMLSGHKGKKKVAQQQESEVLESEVHIENGIDEDDAMECNNRKSGRRRNKKERGRTSDGEAAKEEKNRSTSENEEAAGSNNSQVEEESPVHCFEKKENNNVKDGQLGKNQKVSNKPVDGKGAMKDRNAKSKTSSKGKKAKATSKNPSNLCEKCGEEFESRNKLHKHLGETGHASLKSR